MKPLFLTLALLAAPMAAAQDSATPSTTDTAPPVTATTSDTTAVTTVRNDTQEMPWGLLGLLGLFGLLGRSRAPLNSTTGSPGAAGDTSRRV